MSVFQAQYSGWCDACDGRIEVGQDARYSPDYGDAVIHDDCDAVDGPSPFDLRATDVVCTVCWLVKPCECEDD